MLIEVKLLEPLKTIINRIQNNILSMETLYKFLKIKTSLEQELSIISEQKKILVKRYAVLDENGRPLSEKGKIKIKPECYKECAERIKELNNLKVIVPDLYFTLEELSNLNLTLKDLICLNPFVKN